MNFERINHHRVVRSTLQFEYNLNHKAINVFPKKMFILNFSLLGRTSI